MRSRNEISIGLVLFWGLGQWLVAQPAWAEDTGSITGTVDQLRLVTAVSVVDRIAGKRGERGKIGKTFPGTFDATSGRFAVDGLPLGAIYQLRTTERGLKIERLGPQKALMALMQNIYAVRFGDVLFKASDTNMLTMNAEIVTRAPLMRLNRPSSLAMLDQGAKLVEEQVFGGSFQDIEAITAAAESEAIPATL